MSIGEILVILIVALLVIKPEDIPIITKKLLYFRTYITNLKNEIFEGVAEELPSDSKLIDKELDEFNFYLEKIIKIEGNYHGEYELSALKKRYNKLVEDKIKNNENNNG